MSISYCEKHDISHDEDHQLERPKCETESIEAEAIQQIPALLDVTGWRYVINQPTPKRQQVIITKGANKGVFAFIVNNQKEEIGQDRIYCLEDRRGKQLWNGNSCWFPESFTRAYPSK